MRIGEIFDAAATASETLTPLLWEPIAVATAKDAQLRNDDTVLDACCGTGPFTLHAVTSVAHVDAVDCSAQSLAVLKDLLPAGARARIRHGDVLTWPGRDYSLVICINGLQFFPDMTAAARQLAGYARPDGRVAFLTWSGDGMTEFGMRAWNAIKAAKTGTYTPFTPASPSTDLKYLLTDPERMQQWMQNAVGLENVSVKVHPFTLPREHAWDLVTGSAFRMMLDDLDDTELRLAREFLKRDLTQITTIDCSVHVALGWRAAH